MKVRDYQIEQIDSAISEVLKNKKIVVQLPTGGGKTFEFSLIAKRWFVDHRSSVMILVHREELLNQAYNTIKNLTGIESVIIDSNSKFHLFSSIYIGMIESVKSRMGLFSNVELVVIDECHLANFTKAHDLFEGKFVIGFSATPLSTSKKNPLINYYKKIIIGPSINELIASGNLAQNITRCPKDVVDSTKLIMDNRKGDYNEKLMAEQYTKAKFVNNTVLTYIRHCLNTKTIIFNVNKDHSKKVTQMMNLSGFNCRHLDSDCSKEERVEILDWFSKTDNAILCNVMIATVGFDEPTIRSVILNFSTVSLVKFIQCCGRGSRKIEGKDYFNIIDLGGNCVRFGDWNDDRDWSRMFYNPEKPSEGVAPVKTCPECEGIVHASTKVCPLIDRYGDICGHEFEKRKTAEEKDLEEMILITKGISVDDLIHKNNKKYEYYTFLDMGHEVVKRMYETEELINDTVLMRYFDAYYKLCIDWYNKTLSGKNGNIPDITNSRWHIKRAKNNFDSLVQKLKENA